jgi:hypothetical protein
MPFLKKLALFIHRSGHEGSLASRRNQGRIKSQLFLISQLIIVALFIFIIFRQFQLWLHSKPNVTLTRADWHFVYEDSPTPCDPFLPSVKNCFANPKNETLWASATTYHSPENKSRLEALNGKPFWIGVVIDPLDLENAFRIRANELSLGIIRGSYFVWVDGIFYLENVNFERRPITVTLPITKLSQTEPLRIAIRVQPERLATQADIFPTDSLEGFSTTVHAHMNRELAIFWEKAQPLALFIASLLFATFFFIFWFYAQEKQEYFYVAIYALINAIFQMRKMAILHGLFNTDFNLSIDIFFRYMEGTFGAIIGMAFARTRKIILQISVPLGLLGSTLLAFSFSADSAQFKLSYYWSHWSITLGCALGAAVCLLQSYYLSTIKAKEESFRPRIRRLILFGFGLFMAAVFYNTSSAHAVNALNTMAISKMGQFGLVFYLILIAVLDFREQKLLYEKTPISRYHRRTVLPEKVSGAILIVDLKNSELLLHMGAKSGESGKWVESCLSYMWTAVIHNGGIVLMTEGDQLRAFFDDEHCANSILSALKATDEMGENLALLEKQLEQHFNGGETLPQITFRGAIASGEIRPVWQEMEDARFASWVEAGTTHPFLESARMMELERNYHSPRSVSQIVVAEEVAEKLQSRSEVLEGRWTLRNETIVGKHEKQYTIAIYSPGVNNYVLQQFVS